MNSNDGSNSNTFGNSIRIGRRNFLRSTGAGAIATGLAGCTGNSDSDGGGGSNGGGGTGTAQVDGPIKMGLLAPLPENIALGRAYANAGKIVEKRVNDSGGLLGADIEVIIKDSELDASTTQQRYRELLLQDEVEATFGLLNTESLNQILEDIASQRKIHITSGTGYTGLNDTIRKEYSKFKYVFRSHQNGYIQGFNLANYFETFAMDLGINDIAMLIEDIQGYKPHVRAVREHLPNGIRIKMDETFSPGTKDYRPLLQQAERANVDMAVVFVSVTGPTLINQWARMQPDFALGGFSIAASDPEFYNNNPSGQYMMTAVPGCIANYTPTELTKTFIQEHRDMFDSVPPYYTAYTTHDALWSWVQAVREVETLNQDDVVAALEKNQWEGVQGTLDYYGTDETFEETNKKFVHDLRFDPDYVTPPNYQWQVTDGEGDQVVLWPESSRQGEFQWPDWIDR